MACKQYCKGCKGTKRASLFVVMISLCLFLPISGCGHAQSTLHLQEKCAEGAKKFFVEHISSYGGSVGSFKDEKGSGFNNFKSHYNEHLDKCFIRIGYSYFPKNKNETVINSIELVNAFEGEVLGSFSPSLSCKVGNRTCKTLEEFEDYIRPYMEE
jgi:hypothetical protein